LNRIGDLTARLHLGCGIVMNESGDDVICHAEIVEVDDGV
jgi:hypothetical protein